MGFRGVASDWFESCLTERKMFMDILGNKSTIRKVDIGLPQGSVSSPYLFSLYLCDMSRSSTKLKFVHFADDTTVYMSGDDLHNLYGEMSEELEKVSVWLKTNRLSLNVAKTSYMLFTHAAIRPLTNPIHIQGEMISRVTEVKFLGVCIDERLNYNCHTMTICKKLSSIVGVMNKLKYYVPSVILRQVYFALFQSVLMYGLTVWGGCGKTNRGKIKCIQRRAFKLLDNLPLRVWHPLPFDHLYVYNVAIQFHRLLLGFELEPYFHQRIADLVPDHFYHTRFATNDNLLLTPVRKAVSQRQFFFNGVKKWIDLPNPMKTCQCPREFKAKMKRWLASL